MEFACKVAGSKLVVVLGHSKCGAVTSACDHVELGNITGLLNKIQPAVKKIEANNESKEDKGEFVEKVATENVLLAVEEIKAKSPILKEMYENKQINIVPAMYCVATGEVTWL